MTTAAARVRLGLSATASFWKKISSSSLFVRRSSTLAAAGADIWKKLGSESVLESKLNKEKSLYLCFFEKSVCGDVSHLNQVVRRISLNSDDGYKEGYLRAAIYKRYKEDIGEPTCCGRFGSQILYPSGRGDYRTFTYMNRVNMSTRPLKFQKFKDFSSPKTEPMLCELNGKLYCIDKNLQSRPFEVLDGDGWRPLVKPPLDYESLMAVYSPAVYSSALEGSNKILAWEDCGSRVFCFDVTEPEKGWTEPCSDLSEALPQLGYRRPPVFIQNHHPDLGDFYLVFGYDPSSDSLTLLPFFMSHNCDCFQPILHEPIQLPELVWEYAPRFQGCDYTTCTDADIVDLGGQKFCLVLNKFIYDDPDEGKNTGIIHLLTFEYCVHPNKSSIARIQTQLLSIRRLQYHSKQLRKPDFTHTSCMHVNGAFVL